MKQSYFVLGATIFLFACTPVYVAPRNGPIAHLRVTTPNPYVYAWLHTYREEGCKSPLHFGALGPETQTPLQEYNTPIGMPGGKKIPDSRIVERVIPANKRFTLLYSQYGPHSISTVTTCKFAITFSPEENKNYEIIYNFDAGKCFVLLEEIKSDSFAIERLSVAGVRKEEKDCSPFIF